MGNPDLVGVRVVLRLSTLLQQTMYQGELIPEMNMVCFRSKRETVTHKVAKTYRVKICHKESGLTKYFLQKNKYLSPLKTKP
jgi:hypothetical protein